MAEKKKAQEAQERLLNAALKVFALNGYEGSSTRMLVKEAGANISAIPYYFGSKEGLYEAVLRHILDIAKGQMFGHALKIQTLLENPKATKEEAQQALHQLLAGFVTFLLGEKAGPYFGLIIVREQMQPSKASTILFENLMRPMHETFSRLIAFMTDRAPTEPEIVLSAHMLLGQIMIFKTHLELIRQRLHLKENDPLPLLEITKLIQHHTDAILSGLTGGIHHA